MEQTFQKSACSDGLPRLGADVHADDHQAHAQNAPSTARFSPSQGRLILEGERLTEQLRNAVTRALGIDKGQVENKRHAYIYSPPGAGKTFTVMSTADRHAVELVRVQGASSMNAFVTKLAVAVHLAGGQEIVVWIDDCDSLFMEAEALNVMKGALDAERNVISWSKNLTAQINQYQSSASAHDKVRGEALQAFQTMGSPGVDIPTEHVRFIITSNLRLETPNAVHKTARKMHEAAIRDRVNYVAFDLSSEQSWGWIAHTLLTGDVLGLGASEKQELLLWMHEYLPRLPSTSMRQVRDYAAAMINNPTGYRNDWMFSLMRAHA